MKNKYFNEKENSVLLDDLQKKSIHDLFQSIPQEIQKQTSQALDDALDETEIKKLFYKYEQNNFSGLSFCGYGIYRHFIPESVSHLSSLRGFLTSYTPYQPEMAQGTLQALFEYQSLIAKLTDLDIGNASLYDAATSMVESIRMALRQKPPKQKTQVVLSQGIHPDFLKVLYTYFTPDIQDNLKISFEVVPLDENTGETRWNVMQSEEPHVLVYQNPNFYGVIEKSAKGLKEKFSQSQILYGTSDILSLTLLESPRSLGADIVWGEAQALGIPVSMGGPTLGFMAANKKYIRQMPGRLIGETSAEDSEGEKVNSYVLTLATREQHIRREKATSNICSNQSLMAVRASIFMAALGWQGMQKLALESHRNLNYFKEKLQNSSKVSLLFNHSQNFHELAWRHTNPNFYDNCLEADLIPGVLLPNGFILSYFSDLNNEKEINRLLDFIEKN